MPSPRFTLKQIDKLHDQLGNADTLSEYAEALKAIGVDHYDSYVSDGHTEYFARDGQSVASAANYQPLYISDTFDEARFDVSMKQVEDGKLSYTQMVKAFASCGIEKWTMDTSKLTFTYYTKSGLIALEEDLD